ncbi:BTB/POZ and MATH domain-containing protein 1-like [Aegilops tauschii subsp. strangulata]|uniref:BTB/POZ and MATH domain-containing protein 1-like n=1 Tax=Aegilops tauschii subsp. strangulata TaxID=200361 RepID=UPI001ABBF205|nr:BTB/POZ and MATH domain-containing protein 1-like [Aegilops tauschii subsp. strangulata]
MAELLRSPAATRIRVDGTDAGVFKALLHFIYTDALPEEMAKRETLATMAKPLLVAADRYKLDRLKLICEEALCGHINIFSVGATLAFAEQHCCRVLKEACMHFLADPCNLEAAVATRSFDQLKAAYHPTLMWKQ